VRPLAALLVFLLLLAATPAMAGPEPPSPFATAYNTQRKLVRSGDTLYAAVTAEVGGILMVRVLSTTDGATWTALPPPNATGLASDRSALAADIRGRLHLVWTELEVDGGQVFHASFGDGSWTAPEQLSHSPGYAGFPSLAVDAQDRAHVAWYGFDGAFYQIYYRRLDAAGWTPETALTHEAVDATNPALALARDGRVHIAWFRQNRQGTQNEVAYLRLSGDVVEDTRTVSPAGTDAIDPSLLADASGAVRIAWAALAGGDRIQYAEWSDGAWSAPEFASPAGTGARHPSLAATDGGGVRLVWEGADGQIYAQSRSDGGWSSPSALTAGGVNRYPSTRWAQYHQSVCPAGIDVVWTHEEGSVRSLAHAALPGDACGASGGIDPITVGIVGFLILAVVAAALVRRHRKWYPKQPR